MDVVTPFGEDHLEVRAASARHEARAVLDHEPVRVLQLGSEDALAAGVRQQVVPEEQHGLAFDA
jgi:hypothetical protein